MCCAVLPLTTTVQNAVKPSQRSNADVQAGSSTGPSVMPAGSGITTVASPTGCRVVTTRLFVCAAHRAYKCVHNISKVTS